MNELLGKATALISKATALISKANAFVIFAGPTLFVVIAVYVMVEGMDHAPHRDPLQNFGYFFVAGCALIAAAMTSKKN